mmetsp:Transcript_8069/g.17364  ORF Transcript_8069/g.17364 Transcript_8069/m.17364 type:complete len:406 (-) Transcript_8069:1075-2292(-)
MIGLPCGPAPMSRTAPVCLPFSDVVTGTLVQRYKRFLADVRLDGSSDATFGNNGNPNTTSATTATTVTAHCANPGAMTGYKDPGTRVVLSRAPPESKRKLKYSWELAIVKQDPTLAVGRSTHSAVPSELLEQHQDQAAQLSGEEEQGGFDSSRYVSIGVNTHNANKLVELALTARAIPQLSIYTAVRREVGGLFSHNPRSRADFLLSDPSSADAITEEHSTLGSKEQPPPETCVVEVKSVTMAGQRTRGVALFPDAVSKRATEHVHALAQLTSAKRKKQQHRAVVLLCVQRSDALAVAPAAHIDPAFAEEIAAAWSKSQVEVIAFQAYPCAAGLYLAQQIPFFLTEQEADSYVLGLTEEHGISAQSGELPTNASEDCRESTQNEPDTPETRAVRKSKRRRRQERS